MLEFELKGDYIQLIQLLKVMGWCKSGGEASGLVDKGLVKVNNVVELRRRNKIKIGMIVIFDKHSVLIK